MMRQCNQLLSVACILSLPYPSLAHRGDAQRERGTSSESGDVLLETLPKGHLHSLHHASKSIKPHHFHKKAHEAKHEDAPNSAHSEHQPIEVSPVGSEAQKSLDPPIQLPMEKFVGNGQPPNNSIHSTLLTAFKKATGLEKEDNIKWASKDFGGLFKDAKFSVIRIQTIASEVNWFEPYQQPQDSQFTGTGWAVDLPDVADLSSDPIFITNAHVVRDAHDVQIQIPAVGEQFFEAYVPLICDEFDLAVVQLTENSRDKFVQSMKKAGGLKPLTVVDAPLDMGLEVASVGFPLGSESLKLSQGVISGTEQVEDFICYQTTAPISPGSSGGPLFAMEQGDGSTLRVIGATFASSASAGSQNINYVVAGVAIVQVLEQYKKQRELFKVKGIENHSHMEIITSLLQVPDHEGSAEENAGDLPTAAPTEAPAEHGENGEKAVSKPCDVRHKKTNHAQQRLPHFQFRIAPIDAVGLESNQALYKMFGCNKGVFVSKIMKTSVFNYAQTSGRPLKEQGSFFLTEVDGIPLDSFGMGITKQFLGDRTPFESFMMMKVRPGDIIKIKTCGKGADEKEQEHTLSMEWLPQRYQAGIDHVMEPFWDPRSTEYELFAGITVMQMSLNHIIKLLKSGQSPTLGRWLLPENQDEPRLVVTHVERGNYASRIISPGMVIGKVNGQPVSTLKQFRDMDTFIPKKGEPWTLETDRGVLFATDFLPAMEDQIAKASSGMSFMLCQSLVEASKKLMAESKLDSAKKDSLAQTGIVSSLAPVIANPADRITRLLKREAWDLSASGSKEASSEEAVRRMRAAQSGFVLKSPEVMPEEHLFGSPLPL